MQTRLQERDMAAMALEKERKETEWEARRRARLKKHAIAGAVLFFLFFVLLGLVSLGPLLGTLLGAAFMAPVGAAAGFLISWRQSGRFEGAAIGAGFFTLYMVVVSAIFGALGGTSLFLILAVSPICGGIPGIFIGFHVESDD